MQPQTIVLSSDEEKEQQANNEDRGFIQFTKNTQSKRQILNKKDICPWLEQKTLEIKDPLLRFHNQIIDFYNFISPSDETHKFKEKNFRRIQNVIKETLPGVEVFYFGSFATRLYLPDGDIDISVKTNDYHDPVQAYNKLHKKFLADPDLYTQLQYIKSSKVPLIKFICGQSGIQMDISINKLDGLAQLQYVERMKRYFPEFKYLVFVFKCMLRVRSLSDTYTGGVGSFLLFCMILVYLYEVHRDRKYYTLGEHVLKFMTFYGERDWSNKTILVREGIIADRVKDWNAMFSIVSPQDPSHDVGKAAFKIKDVFRVFKNRVQFINGKNFQPKESLLKILINPSDEKFRYSS